MVSVENSRSGQRFQSTLQSPKWRIARRPVNSLLCLVVEGPFGVREKKTTRPISYAKTPLQNQECRLTVLDELVGGDIANGDTGHFGGCEGGCRR